MEPVISSEWQHADGRLDSFTDNTGEWMYRWMGGPLMVASYHFVDFHAGGFLQIGDQVEIGVHRAEIVDFDDQQQQYLLRRIGFAAEVQ